MITTSCDIYINILFVNMTHCSRLGLPMGHPVAWPEAFSESGRVPGGAWPEVSTWPEVVDRRSGGEMLMLNEFVSNSAKIATPSRTETGRDLRSGRRFVIDPSDGHDLKVPFRESPAERPHETVPPSWPMFRPLASLSMLDSLRV